MTYRRPMFGTKMPSSVVSKAGTVYYSVQDSRNFGV